MRALSDRLVAIQEEVNKEQTKSNTLKEQKKIVLKDYNTGLLLLLLFY